ncbi:AAA family ATPase [Marixanthomonas sp. SCSIO 43207]|uniref:AAA domain-containing protein n=1 Tax=Marixanthomonas sp. SCSIO 43207 TaxID=2779360 RepID=UPI001CA80E99|nr:AAA domain-containing protein [Marixanthomonas sp. SCSIO 43207]UAB82267.1 AAA family ATPase [Marixanthomonas sp. SCSIO 43207]
MAYHNNEDIFDDEPIELVIRFKNKAVRTLDKQNKGNFEELKRWIENKSLKCFFQKKNEEEHKVIFHIENKQIELVLKWQEQTFDYKTIINQKSKNAISEIQELKSDEYTVVENCTIKLIDFKKPHRSQRELEDLFNKICKLEISPKSEIENQQEIWDKWIEAQQLILNKNSEALEVLNYDLPIQIHEFLYQFRVKLKQEENPEYNNLYNIISKEPFNLNERIYPDGSLFIRLKDITDVLDRVIQKDFISILERNKQIGCVLKITPYSIKDTLKIRLNNSNIYENEVRKQVFIGISHIKQKFKTDSVLKKQGFSFSKFKVNFEIISENNIVLNSKINKRFNLTFGSQYRKDLKEKELVLPKPHQNVFTLWKNNFRDLKVFYLTLCRIYSSEKVKTKFYLVYEADNEEVVFSESFDARFWTEIKREFYSFDFDTNVNESQQTVAFDFIDYSDLKLKYEKIKSLNKFNIMFSPLNNDFKFKVKIDIVAKKSKKEEFLDKTKQIAGAEFYIDKGNKFEYKKRQVVIGNLNGRNSDYNHYVFNLPYQWPNEKRQTDKFFKFIEEEPKIKSVTPNLRGDQAKISWLHEAMNKITNPKEGLDLKPVNEKIKDFIFDSSKAEEIHKDLSVDGENWNELKRHELLTLNNSQRKAVLSALNCTDLALLQGPPGTGKTTVIAEMIWQMVRVNQEQKILLTSETNLAVDNALEKLLNKNHTLVKPIRFGRASKFEEEGKKYAFERIMKWVDEKYETNDNYENEVLKEDDIEIVEEDFYNNSVQLWMRRIANNSQQSNPKYRSIMKDWAFEMAQPDKEMKILFKDKYFKYANVVGSTSSSAGSPNFGADYQRIFNESKFIETKFGDVEIEKFAKKVKNIIKRYKSDFSGWYAGVNVIDKLKPIEFDTVITDEASKATPPELLLPMCFGRRNIIIGDHRQLPPMLHDKTFKETLESLETTQAKELASEIDKDFVETSQFERLIMHPKVSPTIKSTFNEQYRMHPKINNVIKQFYLDEGGLEPGKPIKENANDPNLNNPFSRHHGFLLNKFINPDIHTIWVNVDEPEELSGTSRINNYEIEAVELVIKLLKKSNGFEEYMKHWQSSNDQIKVQEEQEIGLISFYGHQVSKLKEVALKARNKYDIPIRLNTVDKFQGMERNIIIVSTVRSDKKIENGEIIQNRDIGFAKSPKRLNVALSRAKRLLIVVGNKDMFYRFKDKNGNQIYKNVIDTINNEGIVVDFKDLKKEFGNDE